MLCQVFHEEIHPITDPVVLAGATGAARDTRVSAAGHALHRDLERTALEVGRAVVEARLPALAPVYADWVSSHS